MSLVTCAHCSKQIDEADAAGWNLFSEPVCNACYRDFKDYGHKVKKLKEFGKVTVHNLEPDDVIVFTLRQKASMESMSRMRSMLEETFPGHKIVIMDDGTDLTIVRGEKV